MPHYSDKKLFSISLTMLFKLPFVTKWRHPLNKIFHWNVETCRLVFQALLLQNVWQLKDLSSLRGLCEPCSEDTHIAQSFNHNLEIKFQFLYGCSCKLGCAKSDVAISVYYNLSVLFKKMVSSAYVCIIYIYLKSCLQQCQLLLESPSHLNIKTRNLHKQLSLHELEPHHEHARYSALTSIDWLRNSKHWLDT